MADRLHVGTRKGLFELVRTRKGWDVAETRFLGDPISAVLVDADGAAYAALDLGHFGAKLWRRDKGGDWAELPAPSFPEKPAEAKDDPHPWSLVKIWGLEPGGVPGRLWAGTIPGGLFRSDDRGASWTLIESLWRSPERAKWGGAGGDQPGISVVLVDPKNPADLRLGVSTGGVWASGDTGRTWSLINQGMYAEYMPPELAGDPISQDVHCLSRCAAQPNVIWCQHHNGVFRSEDAGATWSEVKAIRPAKFGFVVAAHPNDPQTAWFVPATKDEKRYPVDGKVVVARTRDGGKSFDVLTKGLPQKHAYDLTLRHALSVDASGERLAFGTTSGGLWISEDGGDTWMAPEMRLPPVAVVRFAEY
ncbi:sialidase family protein [Desertibaculum subflavum]|uniref:sialidase family protein n=1 Tax=Desertibaculum subflavum TaxID=2268458 RepID=UPI000E660A39